MASVLASKIPIDVSEDRRKVNGRNTFKSVPFLLHVLRIREFYGTRINCKRNIQHSTLTDNTLCSKSITYVGIRI